MLWTILVILVILWLLGFIGHFGGNLIHILIKAMKNRPVRRINQPDDESAFLSFAICSIIAARSPYIEVKEIKDVQH